MRKRGLEPVNPGRGLVRLRGNIFRLSARGRYQIDIAARGSLIAHQSTDKRDSIAGGRPAGYGDLQAMQRARRMFGIENRSRLAACQWLGVKLRHPPVVFSRRGRGHKSELPGIGRPVIFIHMKVGGADLAEFAGGGFHGSHALDLQPLHSNNPGRRLHGSQRPGRPGGAFDVQAGNVQAVGRKCQAGDATVQMGQPPG